MAKSINRIELLGRVGKDPELRYTQGGASVVNFSVATDRWVKPEAEPITDWHRVTAWNALAEAINQHVAKGARIYVSGPLQMREYTDADGNRRTSYDVVARDVVFIDFRGDEGGGGRQRSARSTEGRGYLVRGQRCLLRP